MLNSELDRLVGFFTWGVLQSSMNGIGTRYGVSGMKDSGMGMVGIPLSARMRAPSSF